jgi:hypothetical protein
MDISELAKVESTVKADEQVVVSKWDDLFALYLPHVSVVFGTALLTGFLIGCLVAKHI